MKPILLASAVLLAATHAAHAQILWNEFTQGDLSGDRFHPTPFNLAEGSNILFGVMTGDDGTGTIDRDYFSITIPQGHVLARIDLLLYLSDDFAAFAGIQPGPIFPNDPDTVLPGDLLGWVVFGFDHEGQDLLAEMSLNGQTFTPPLPAGTYTLWAQQLDSFTEWTPDFVVEPVPAPATLALAALGVMAMRRRRST
ncbi:MAG: hypothetical protein HBSAPP03_23710 [Phycisphaerae bacterium]|nr:MAG: hypothetical protein HBSAPP03_23710 [Phycisphaerae bacterium]